MLRRLEMQQVIPSSLCDRPNRCTYSEGWSVNEWRNKFVGMERAAEDATEICNELKREFGLMETKFKNELEMRKGIEMEYERLKDLVKPQTETMEQMAIELKRALEREQTVRNELRSVHAKFAQQFM